jgi:hypothetical protein
MKYSVVLNSQIKIFGEAPPDSKSELKITYFPASLLNLNTRWLFQNESCFPVEPYDSWLSLAQCCGSRSVGSVWLCGLPSSGSGCFHHQAKIVSKAWFPLFCDFFMTFYPWKMNDVNVRSSVQKVIRKGLEVTDENGRIRNRIQIHLSDVRIHNTGLAIRNWQIVLLFAHFYACWLAPFIIVYPVVFSCSIPRPWSLRGKCIAATRARKRGLAVRTCSLLSKGLKRWANF